MEKRMFYGARPIIFKRARELRIFSTEAEQKLWAYLRTKPLGIKFRRQHPLGRYIADFYAHKIKLVIEADGGYHLRPEVMEKDRQRQNEIESEGIAVIRFTNEKILLQPDAVRARIEACIGERLAALTPEGLRPPDL